jgi:hypothetical protein
MCQVFNVLIGWINTLAGISICPGTAPRFGCAFDILWGDSCSVLQRNKTRRTRRQVHHHGSHLQRHVSCRVNTTLVGSGRCAKVGYLCDYGVDGKFFFFPTDAHKAGDGEHQ